MEMVASQQEDYDKSGIIETVLTPIMQRKIFHVVEDSFLHIEKLFILLVFK